MIGAFQVGPFQPAYQQGGAPVVVVDDAATPGFHPRFVGMLRERYRDREDALPLAPSTIAKLEGVADLSAYYRQSAKLAATIAERRTEAAQLRERIARLEAEALAARQREREAIEHRLLLAQQRLTLISVQEAVLLDEMEMIDVAFFAVVAVAVVLN